MRISQADAKNFLPTHLQDARAAIAAADKNGNGNLTRSEAEALGEFKDTYDLYKTRGRTVRTNDFLAFYEKHAAVSVNSGGLSGDLVNNFISWRTSAPSGLTDRERTDAVWDVMSTSGVLDSGPRLVTSSSVPDSVKSWIASARSAAVAADPRTEDIWEMYEVPVSPTDSRVAGYALLGWGELSPSTGYESLHIYSPDGRLLDSDGQEVSF
jgi:hypothetical protein